MAQGGRALGHGLGMEGAGGEVSGRLPPPTLPREVGRRSTGGRSLEPQREV